MVLGRYLLTGYLDPQQPSHVSRAANSSSGCRGWHTISGVAQTICAVGESKRQGSEVIRKPWPEALRTHAVGLWGPKTMSYGVLGHFEP